MKTQQTYIKLKVKISNVMLVEWFKFLRAIQREH